MEKAYRYRFYPTPEQESLLRRTMGCVRLVYNKALAVRTDAWYQHQERVGYEQTSSMLTSWKKEEDLNFLNEVSCVPLQQGLRHLQKAFTNFWSGRAQYPSFKKKHKGGSAEFTKSAFRWKDGQVFLAKCSEPLPIRWSRLLPSSCAPSTITIKLDARGRWFVSLLVDDPTVKPFPQGKITDARTDFWQKLTTQLVRENQTIVIEELAVQNRVKNPNWDHRISDTSWGQLTRQLTYKCQWYGRELVKIDRRFPNSKRCSNCGYIVEKMPLKVRQWQCSQCGTHHDGDLNAAKNILAAGLAVSAPVAHGENPQDCAGLSVERL